MAGFYTTHEAARLLGVSLPTVVNWIKGRRLKAHRTPGGHRRIAAEDLAELMVRHGIPVPPELSDAASVRRKALVVAQAGPLREGVARQLAQAGLAVEQASPGFAAGTALARFVPDVVVLSLPRQEGAELLQALRSDREQGEVPVVWAGPSGPDPAEPPTGHQVALAWPLAEGSLAGAVERLLAEAEAGQRRGARRPRSRTGP
jgi:excisionase family DNA binding protein